MAPGLNPHRLCARSRCCTRASRQQFHIANIHNEEGLAGAALFGRYMDGVAEQFDRIASLGVEVHVTEIDVGCNLPTLPCPTPFLRLSYDPGARQRVQAGVFARVLAHCLNTTACTVYQMWGSTDRYSWRNGDWGEGANLFSWYNQRQVAATPRRHRCALRAVRAHLRHQLQP